MMFGQDFNGQTVVYMILRRNDHKKILIGFSGEFAKVTKMAKDFELQIRVKKKSSHCWCGAWDMEQD
jgi:hypothetical protein